MSETCETCKWWKPPHRTDWATEARGECHGAPPQIKRVERGGYYEPGGYRMWPVTDRDDFCASHEACSPQDSPDQKSAQGEQRAE